MKGPVMEDGGVSRRCSPKLVSAEQGVMLPDVSAWTPAARTASSLESLRLISADVSGCGCGCAGAGV